MGKRKSRRSQSTAVTPAKTIDGHVSVLEKGANVPRTYDGDGPNVWNNIGTFLSDLTGTAVNNRMIGWTDAMQQAAVVACLDIMAQDIARAPLVLYRRKRGGGSEAVDPRDHHLARLFWLKPNKFMTWNEFTQMIVYHLGLASNGYIVPRKTLRGRVEELIPVLPGRVDIQVAPSTQELVYRVYPATAYEEIQLGAPDGLILFGDEIIHIKHRFFNGVSGLSTLAVGNRTFALAERVEQFTSRLFGRDGTLRGVFETEETFEQDQYDRLVSGLNAAMHRLRDEGFPLVLENKLKFNKISMTAEEAESGDQWDRMIAQTARLFRIPLHKIGHLTAVKYDNMAPMEAGYVNDSLIPRCQAIEQRLDMALLTEDEQLEYYIEFDRKVLHRADEKALNERVTKQFQAGIITQNQALEELGYNPAKNGNVYQIPANTVLIDENHKIIVHPGNRGKTAGNDEEEGQTDDAAKDDTGDDAE